MALNFQLRREEHREWSSSDVELVFGVGLCPTAGLLSSGHNWT